MQELKSAHIKFFETCFQVQRTKISTRQVPLAKNSTQQVSWTKSVSRRENKCTSFRKRKNQHATSFINKTLYATTNQNQRPISPLIKVSFTRRKINAKLLRREKSTCSKFHEQKSAYKNFQEWNAQQVPWTKSVSRWEKPIYKLHEENKSTFFFIINTKYGNIRLHKSTWSRFCEQNLHATNSKNKNQHATSPLIKINFTRKKINVQDLLREKSACLKFHGQNQFHEEKNQFTSFTKWKINSFTNKVKSVYEKSHVLRKEKQHTISFKNKNQWATASMSKNQHATSSMNKISFTMTKVDIQVSWKEKSICNMFQERKSARNKLHEQN